MAGAGTTGARRSRERGVAKCVVWDLDNTLWNGVLLEDPEVCLRAGLDEVIRGLDRRGILNSIASRNEPGLAEAKLEQFGLKDLFLFPQINWNPKSQSIRSIARELNIATDSLAFVDDDEFELDEVAFSVPDVLCVNARDADTMLDRPEFMPLHETEESRQRRRMYIADRVRSSAETEFTGPKEEFLASLHMRFEIAPAQEGDLRRAEELTLRTNQLNTTGRTYSYEELDAFRRSDRYALLMARLEDAYGPYGTIGLALIETEESEWVIKLLLMSCRVMSRGVGSIMLNHIRRLAQLEGARLLAEFVPTDRNRIMYVSYKFNSFKEIERQGDTVWLESSLDDVPPSPPYVQVCWEPA